MRLIRIIIIDDEESAREILRLMLLRISDEYNVVGEAESVKQGVQLINELDFDLLFLDIKLLDGTGFDILNQVVNFNSKLIFTTAFDEYAIDAFRKNAIDYLLKPIDFGELKRAIEKCKLYSEKQFDQTELISALKEEIYGQRITVISSNTVDFINSRDIIYLQSEGAYTTIFLSNKKNIVCTKSLKHFEKLLKTQRFFRINKSDLINLDMVSQYRKDLDHGQLFMKNGDVLPISRRKKSDFKQIIQAI